MVRGGPSSEYDISLKTGAEVLKNLPEKYRGRDVLLTKGGEWHLDGFSKTPAKIFENVDVIFNALHGEFGEDGRAQQVFESFNMPYTGSGVIPSVLAMKKHRAREVFERAGIKFPRHLIFRQDPEDFLKEDPEDFARIAFNAMPPKWVVKPASLGSSVGVGICGSFSELVSAIDEAFYYDNTILVEEHIKGREATCGVLENFRGEKNYALPAVEIIPPENTFFDYNVKYDGSTREICPAGFEGFVKREIEEISRKAHEILGCRHYSRSDFIVSPARAGKPPRVYLLEINTLPGLTAESLLPKAAAVAGLDFSDLLDHILQLALNKR